jgi:hypothetical protein
MRVWKIRNKTTGWWYAGREGIFRKGWGKIYPKKAWAKTAMTLYYNARCDLELVEYEMQEVT